MSLVRRDGSESGFCGSSRVRVDQVRVRVGATLRMRVAGQSGHRIKGLFAKNLHIYLVEKSLNFLSMEKDCMICI